MRKIAFLLFVFSFAALASFAQKSQPVPFPKLPLDDKGEVVTYSKVITLEGVTAQQLYERGKKWFFEYYKNPTEKIRVDDAEKKEMEGFIRFKLMVPDKKGVESDVATIQYSIFLTFKDGRYKYTINNINEKGISNLGIETWIPTLPAGKNAPAADADKHAQWLTIIDKNIKETINAMEKGMKDPGVEKKEDW